MCGGAANGGAGGLLAMASGFVLFPFDFWIFWIFDILHLASRVMLCPPPREIVMQVAVLGFGFWVLSFWILDFVLDSNYPFLFYFW